MMAATHSMVDTNGIHLHVTQQGEGPAVLLLHGFPETSHAWRHQLQALSAAGYHAIAPDLRGYGRSECPADVAAYSSLDVLADLVGLLDKLALPQAVVVGNDWGATIAWQAAQLRPDRFRAVVGLGVPLMGRAPMLPSRLFPQNDDAWFYTHYFSHASAKDELEADIKTTLRKIYHGASGDIGERGPHSVNPFGMVSRQRGYLEALPAPAHASAWMTEEDLATFERDFAQSGFQGGLNYYRNLDRNWQLQGAFEGARISVPALYMAGERDTGLAMPGMKEIIAGIPQLAPDLRDSLIIPGAGHWLQQEAAGPVSGRIITFLRSL